MKKIILSTLILLVSSYSFSQLNCLNDTIHHYKFISGTQVKELIGRTIFQYDANNNETEKLYQKWNSGSNTWESDYKYNYTYDANNNLSEELYQKWDTRSNTWKNSSKYNYAYDAVQVRGNENEWGKKRWGFHVLKGMPRMINQGLPCW